MAAATFRALFPSGLCDDHAQIDYVRIGARGGASAEVPAELLRGRRIQ